MINIRLLLNMLYTKAKIHARHRPPLPCTVRDVPFIFCSVYYLNWITKECMTPRVKEIDYDY